MSLQEKFQIIAPPKKEDGHEWVDHKSARTNQGNVSPDECNKFNRMPPGYNIDDGRSSFNAGFGGDTDVSGGVNAKTLPKGFDRKTMGAAEDIYTGEHVDLFYGEAKDEDGNVGFVERNNYLDRS